MAMDTTKEYSDSSEATPNVTWDTVLQEIGQLCATIGEIKGVLGIKVVTHGERQEKEAALSKPHMRGLSEEIDDIMSNYRAQLAGGAAGLAIILQETHRLRGQMK